MRVALYYAPPAGSGLAAAAAAWLGWDPAAGAAVAHPEAAVDLPHITERARIYGFHGTLKAPFRLAEGRSLADLTAATDAFGRAEPPVDLPGLRIGDLDGFVAAVPSGPSPALAAFAARVVEAFEPFRAPLTEADLTRRRAAGLTPAQDALLLRWGYPYTHDQFRFHMTLSRRVEDPAPVIAEAERLVGPHLGDAVPLRALALFVQEDGAPFRIAHRAPLAGS